MAAILAAAIPEQKNPIQQGFAALAMLGSEPSMPLKVDKGKASLASSRWARSSRSNSAAWQNL